MRVATARRVAVFDFDGTITRHDSFVHFLTFAVPSRAMFTGAASLAPRAVAYALHVEDNEQFKQHILKRFFAGMPAWRLDRLAAEFAARRLPRLVRPAALERLRWHIDERHRVIIVTASLEAYVRPWAVRNGIDQVLGTRLEVDGAGLLTGRIDGRNCYGREKITRLESLLGDLGKVTLYAYGDGRGDRELLEVATYPVFRPFRTALSRSPAARRS